MKKVILLILMIGCILPFNVLALEDDINIENDIIIYIFYGEKCPYSHQEKEFLAENVIGIYENIDIKMYEQWYEKKNTLLGESVRESFDLEGDYVPLTIIGTEYILGYSEEIGEEIIELIESQSTSDSYYDIVASKIDEIEFNEKTTKTINSKGVIVNYYTNYFTLILSIIALILIVALGAYILINHQVVFPIIKNKIDVCRRGFINFKDKVMHHEIMIKLQKKFKK